MRQPFASILLFCTLLAVGLAGTASAQGARVVTEHVEAELISEQTAIVPGQPFTLALRIQHAPHWHTYWRNPGDSGIATQIAWQLPEGFKASPIQWPHPKRLPVGPLANFGYEDEVFLLIEIDPGNALTQPTAGQTVTLAARADWLVCKDICLPENGSFRITLPVVAAVSSEFSSTSSSTSRIDERWQEGFARSRAALPVARSDWGVAMTTEGNLARLTLDPPAGFAGTLSDIQFFPFREGLIENAAPQPLAQHDGRYTLAIPLAAGAQFTSSSALQTLSGILVSRNGWSTSGDPRPTLLVGTDPGQAPATITVLTERTVDAGTVPSASSLGLFTALGFALIGGLILNLMPCVFPVLGIKVMSFVAHAGHDQRLLRRQGLLFLAGVVVSFLALAGLLIALRAGGTAIGWGFQLQSPAFVTALAILFTLLALNLFGLFEIGTSVPQATSNFRTHNFSGQAFFSGVLATVVATPCTAPFMGAAMGYTLTQPPALSFLVFAFLALGMAAPVVFLSWFPAALRWLPRPGAWMLRFRQVMAFPLLATVIWLIWVLGAQTGNDGVMQLLAGLLVVALAAWLYGLASARRNPLGILFAALIAVGGLVLAWPDGTLAPAARVSSSAQPGEPAWQPYSRAVLEQLRAERKPVFVDFTAKWCITCQVNKQVALHNDAVVRRFAERGVVPLQADWTNRDPAITAALAEFGRNAVPLYVLYVPDQQEPIVLPELLTPQIVLEALDRLPVADPASIGL